jgi:hypothetical protein
MTEIEYEDEDEYSISVISFRGEHMRGKAAGLSLARMPFACQPDQGTKVILFPAAVSRFEPKKAPGVDAYDTNIQSVVNRKDNEVIHQDQRDMNERSDAEE